MKVAPPEKKEYKVLSPDFYEAIVANVRLVPNDSGQYAYNPATDPAHKSHQLEWTFRIREDGNEDVTVRAYSPQVLSRHPKAKLPKWLAAMNPDFNIDDGFETDDYLGVACRVLIENTTKEKDGETRTYNKVAGIAATKLKQLSAEEVEEVRKAALAFNKAADDLDGEEIPF